MRYLTRGFAAGALRRGKEIEQFLGATAFGGEPAIKWVTICPVEGRYRVSLNTAQDPDDEFGDLADLMPLDPVDEAYAGEGRVLGAADDGVGAMLLAERLTGATPERWVNAGVAGEDYMDLVRARREQA